jgi:hypothetical protein
VVLIRKFDIDRPCDGPGQVVERLTQQLLLLALQVEIGRQDGTFLSISLRYLMKKGCLADPPLAVEDDDILLLGFKNIADEDENIFTTKETGFPGQRDPDDIWIWRETIATHRHLPMERS